MKESNNNSQESKEPIKIKLLALILLLAIIIIIIIVFWIYKLIQENNEIEKDTEKSSNSIETISNSNNITELDINSSTVAELYAKLLQYNYIYEESPEDGTWNYVGSFYKDTKTTVNDLSNTEKIVAVLQYIEDTPSSSILSDEAPTDIINHSQIQTTVNIYSSALINETKEKILGLSANINWKDFDNGVGGNWYYYNDCYYYDEGAGGGLGCGILTGSEIEKAEQFEDEIYIYDKFVYSESSPSGEYSIYTSSDKSKLISNGDEINENILGNSEKLIEQFKDLAQTYKHTFKKNSDGTYYWYSTEQVD